MCDGREPGLVWPQASVVRVESVAWRERDSRLISGLCASKYSLHMDHAPPLQPADQGPNKEGFRHTLYTLSELNEDKNILDNCLCSLFL